MDEQLLYPSEIEQMCREAQAELSHVFGDGTGTWEDIPQPYRTLIAAITVNVVHRVQRGDYPRREEKENDGRSSK